MRGAGFLRELADLDEQVRRALEEAIRPTIPDEVLSLKKAATLLGERAATFYQRLEYRKALISRRGQKLRYSLAELERIRRDRLAPASDGVVTRAGMTLAK